MKYILRLYFTDGTVNEVITAHPDFISSVKLIEKGSVRKLELEKFKGFKDD